MLCSALFFFFCLNVNTSSILDNFNLLRAFLFFTRNDITPKHSFPKCLRSTPSSFKSHAFLIPVSLPTPDFNCLKATNYRGGFTQKPLNQTNRHPVQTLAQELIHRRQVSDIRTSLLLHRGCVSAGEAGPGWAAGLELQEWTLLLPDSAVELESESESELECLSRLLCVCARCGDRLSVNTDKHQRGVSMHTQLIGKHARSINCYLRYLCVLTV